MTASDEKLDSRERFPDAMARWIRKQFPAFDELHAKNGDETQFANNKFDEFVEEFGEAQCNEMPNCKKRFQRKFWNRANDLRKTEARAAPSTQPSASSVPLYLVPDAPEVKARDLYKAAHNDEMNIEVTALRKTLGQDYSHHAGHFQHLWKQRWDGLSVEDREKWVSEAVARNAAGREAVLNSTIFDAQNLLPRKLYSIFEGMLHGGPGGIGEGAFHLLYSCRDPNSKLITGCLTVTSVGSDADPFQTACKDYKTNITAPWQQFSHQNVALNPAPINYDEKLKKNGSGIYLLPVYDEETQTMSAYRGILRIFVEASFFHVVPRSGAVPAMPWSDFLAHPEDFFDPRLILEGILTRRPEDMPSDDVRKFAARIHKFQADYPASCIFESSHFIGEAVRNRKAVADAQRADEMEEIIEADDDHGKDPLESPLTSPTSSPRVPFETLKPVDPPPVLPALPSPSPPPAPRASKKSKGKKRKADEVEEPSIAEDRQVKALPLRRSTRANVIEAHEEPSKPPKKRRKSGR
ncbi:hypothetical protein R3P38DRAFT_3287643 [Favolaschia claudopus]|uniref:Uncharacterized protein n=1 Tax=Favolaschia claudopus TaxID=2862362 RepID=A0AAV9ZZ99_9AGAR